MKLNYFLEESFSLKNFAAPSSMIPLSLKSSFFFLNFNWNVIEYRESVSESFFAIFAARKIVSFTIIIRNSVIRPRFPANSVYQGQTSTMRNVLVIFRPTLESQFAFAGRNMGIYMTQIVLPSEEVTWSCPPAF